ncbi:hypothetical protein CROQUDRAFT_110175 [Cronartium quercuum f. sp. fusiforme G11]|uniref:Uncharacterized protein n=1 Tax=Cronartium quercuum f. sp. fusiforme G11 TaxID=708437 RepID=A0A9P6N8J5_9BASI|nr:hypothetical protein CROQUDRAFT_110175 [Cronartium quercuum f. sp. fusiforme G11]
MLLPLKISALTILLLTTSNFIKSQLDGTHIVSESIKPHAEEVLSRESFRNEVNSEKVDREVSENLLPQAEKSLPGTDGTTLPMNIEARHPPLEEVENRRPNMPNTGMRIEQRLKHWDPLEYKADWIRAKLPLDAMDMMGKELTLDESTIRGTLLAQETRGHWENIRVKFRRLGLGVEEKMNAWWKNHFRERRDSGWLVLQEWEFRKTRVGLNKPIWWNLEQMREMRKHSTSWKQMIEIGDLLAFNEKSPSFRIDSNQHDHIINELLYLNWPHQDWQSYESDTEMWLSMGACATLKKLFQDENHKPLYETRITQILNVGVTHLKFKNLLDNHILEDVEDHGWIPKVTLLEWLHAGLHPKSMSLYAASMVVGQSRTGTLPAYVSEAWLRWDPVTKTQSRISDGFAKAREYYSHLLGSEHFNQRLSNVFFKIKRLLRMNFLEALISFNPKSMNLELRNIKKLKSMLATRNNLRRAARWRGKRYDQN